MKTVPIIFHFKEFINKNSEKKAMLPHQSVFFGDHRGKFYIKKINMTHFSPRT